MKWRFLLTSVISVTIPVALVAAVGRTQTQTHTGIVERVWDDGFELNLGDRRLLVDSYDIYDDNTPSQVSVGDRLSVTGEFDDGEFDATAIAHQEAETDSTSSEGPTSDPQSVEEHERGESYTGRVTRVWEDGFLLNTEDRRLRVDSYDVYGDKTPSQVSVGDRVRVRGEFDEGEFDAFSIDPSEIP